MNEVPSMPDDVEPRLRRYFQQRSAEAAQRIPALWQRIASQLPDDDHAATTEGAYFFHTPTKEIPLMQPPHPLPTPSAPPSRRVLSFAAVLLAACIVLAAFWFTTIHHAGAGPASSAPSAHATATAPSNVCLPPVTGDGTAPQVFHVPTGNATAHDISLQIDAANADAAQTLVRFRLISSAYYVPPQPVNLILTDEAGTIYQTLGGQAGGLYGSGIYHTDEQFEPLSRDDLKHAHQLTLTIIDMLVNSTKVNPGSTTGGTTTTLHGVWQTSFTITPARAQSSTFSVPPVTHCGVSMRVLSLDLASDTIPFYGENSAGNFAQRGSFIGGARLVFQLSNLPPRATLNSIIGGFALLEDNGFLNAQGGGKGKLLLNGQQTVQVVRPNRSWDFVSGGGDPTVGPSGSLLLEALYFSPLAHSTNVVTMHLNSITITLDDGHSTEVLGPWDFQLPLNNA